MGTIIQSLATGLNIEKNARVTKISYGGRLATDDGMPCPSGDNVSNALVLVETASGLVLRARRVVVATPVAPLLKGELNIEPGLPEMKLKVLSELKLVPKIKIFLKFGVLPWPRNVTGVIMAGCSIPDVTFHEISKAQKAECACYCTGICSAKFADDLKESSEDDLIKLLLEQLDNVFSLLPAASEGSDSLPLPSSVYIGGMVSVWNETIPCLGSFTTRVVDEQQAAILGSPLCDKVFFAGEVTVRGTGLRLHDAMASGLLAADAVAASLSSPRLADALDRYFSQPTATVVGFGSLMAESSARATFPHLKNFRVVRVHGYRRMFGHSPSVMVDRGMATHGSMQQGCLSAEPVYLSAAEENGLVKRLDMSVGFLGVCFDVGMNDLRDAVGGIVGVGGRMWCGEALMKREEEFNFDIVTCQKVSKTGETLDECFPGLMCVASTDEEFKKRWGEIVYAKTLSKTGLNTIWDWDKKSKLKPCSAYANHCYLAAQSLGSHVINSFLDETVLVDRATTIRTYLARNPDVLFYQPPPMHDSRHLTDRVKKTPPRPSKQGVPPELPFPPRLDLPAANAETPAEEIDNKLFTLTTAVTCTLLFGATIYLLYRKRFASK